MFACLIFVLQFCHRMLILMMFVLGIGGSFQNGFHTSVINSPSLYIQSFINDTWMERYGKPVEAKTVKLIWSIIVSIFSAGGVVGVLSTRYLAVKYGRKKCMLYNNIITIVASVMMGLSYSAKSFELILAGRFIYGISAGIGQNMHCLYLTESAPKKLRGIVNLTVVTFGSIGKCWGQVLGLREHLGQENLWPLLLAFNGLPALIQLVTLPFFPEAPRYLLIDKGERNMCERALETLWGKKDLTVEIEDMLAEQATINGEKPKRLLDLFKDKSVRWQVITTIMACTFLQFSGLHLIYSYSFYIFGTAGVPIEQSRYVTVGISITEILTSVACGLCIERIGRRLLLCNGYSFMALIMTLLTVTLTLQDWFFWMPYCSVFLIFVYVISFGMGPAGTTGSLLAELFLQSYRPAAYVLIGIIKCSGLFLIGLVFPFIIDGLGSFSFLIFLGNSLCAAVFVFLFVPETKGKTILEISEDFKKIKLNRKNTKRSHKDDSTFVVTKF
uniref:Major facilitator superfamily (MFS) profile domain-containing protein n=2 Tax=Latimeria chalumnae TaxID=7897 RepID=H3A0N7_LATCH